MKGKKKKSKRVFSLNSVDSKLNLESKQIVGTSLLLTVAAFCLLSTDVKKNLYFY